MPQQNVNKEQTPKTQITKTNIQPKKPVLTTTPTPTVQTVLMKSPSAPVKPTPIPQTRPVPQTSVDAIPKGKLPQVPPRLPSQSSINRGPPPVIPPRPVRSGSVQQPSSSSGRVLVRQQSASSMPMCTPQPPPKFVIPQRQNSKTSLTRSGSVSSQGSPSTPRRQ